MRGLCLRLTVVVAILLAAACAPSIPAAAPPTITPPTAVPPAPTPDPAAPVKSWVAAINSGDVDAALALFDDKLNFMMGGEYTASNKEQLR